MFSHDVFLLQTKHKGDLYESDYIFSIRKNNKLEDDNRFCFLDL